MKSKLIALIAAFAFFISGARAQEFFSTSEGSSLFTLGVRAGVNTSNRTISNKSWGIYNYQSWGTGFIAGVIADLNIRDYLAIEPGVFFESRGGHSSFISETFVPSGDPYYITQEANRRNYSLNIPVLASVRFNVTGRLRWHIDLGPYFSFLLKSNLDNKELISTRPDLDNRAPFAGHPSKMDFGLKIGTAFELSRHLYFGIHYEAGMVDAYRNEDLGNNLLQVYGGRTKAWDFTLGWNF